MINHFAFYFLQMHWRSFKATLKKKIIICKTCEAVNTRKSYNKVYPYYLLLPTDNFRFHRMTKCSLFPLYSKQKLEDIAEWRNLWMRKVAITASNWITLDNKIYLLLKVLLNLSLKLLPTRTTDCSLSSRVWQETQEAKCAVMLSIHKYT